MLATHDAQYPTTTPKTLLSTTQNGDQYMDTSASSLITPKFSNLTQSSKYQGIDQVTIRNETNLAIAHTDEGLLATLKCNLLLHNLLRVP